MCAAIVEILPCSNPDIPPSGRLPYPSCHAVTAALTRAEMPTDLSQTRDCDRGMDDSWSVHSSSRIVNDILAGNNPLACPVHRRRKSMTEQKPGHYPARTTQPTLTSTCIPSSVFASYARTHAACFVPSSGLWAKESALTVLVQYSYFLVSCPACRPVQRSKPSPKILSENHRNASVHSPVHDWELHRLTL